MPRSDLHQIAAADRSLADRARISHRNGVSVTHHSRPNAPRHRAAKLPRPSRDQARGLDS